MLDLKKIQEFTKLPDKIIINGKTAWLALIQMPEDRVSIGYYFKEDGKTMEAYREQRIYANEVDLFDMIIDFQEFMERMLESEIGNPNGDI